MKTIDVILGNMQYYTKVVIKNRKSVFVPVHPLLISVVL